MTTTDAYSARAQEYADLLGSIEAMAPQDRRGIETWAADVDDPILDAGCGPGHWTAHLAALGHDAHGMDPVPEFVRIARHTHPDVPYRLGAFADLEERPGEWGGILAWYSLIHLAPSEVPGALEILHRALRPTGSLLIGFFGGERQEAFDHAVTIAQYWPVAEMAALLDDAGLEVQEIDQRHDPGARPHAAISARRR